MDYETEVFCLSPSTTERNRKSHRCVLLWCTPLCADAPRSCALLHFGALTCTSAVLVGIAAWRWVHQHPQWAPGVQFVERPVDGPADGQRSGGFFPGGDSVRPASSCCAAGAWAPTTWFAASAWRSAR